MDRLCIQPKLLNEPTIPFDFAAYRSESGSEIFVAGETKRDAVNLNKMIAGLLKLSECNRTYSDEMSSENSGINQDILKKWKAIVRWKPVLFRAVGPNDYTRLFQIRQNQTDLPELVEISLNNLYFSQIAQSLWP